VDRKQCAGCGETSLAQDPTCWACGGTRFLQPGVVGAVEPTLALDGDLHRTHAWDEERRPYFALWCVGAGVLFALFLGAVGFWLGRASAPESAASPAPVAANPLSLPTPPTPLAPASAVPTPRPDWTLPQPPAPAPDPSVRVRTHPGAPGAGPAPPSHVAPSTVLGPQAPTPGEVTIAAQPFPGGRPRLPAPTADTAVVGLLNSTEAPIAVSFEGPDTRTATVAAGGLLPLTLPAGNYQIRVSGGGGEPARSQTTLNGGRTYSLNVDSRKEEGRQMLIVVEPAIEGVPG
jgi:hypothetical protein